MKCTNCGAELLDTDQFCNKCGQKVVRQRKCPDCGTILRDGTKFCHKCGRLVDGSDAETVVEPKTDTLDIPIEVIEQNILSETEAEMGSARERMLDRARMENAAQHRKPATKKPVYEKYEEDEDDDYEEDVDYEDEEYDEDDYEEDDTEGEGRKVDIMTIMTVVVGCVLLLLVILLGYHFYRQYVPKNYEQAAEEAGQETEDSEEENGGETVQMQLTVVSNVNVRDNPNTSGTNVIKVAKAGETYECVGTAGDGNWYEIVLDDGTHGYVYTDYVKVE